MNEVDQLSLDAYLIVKHDYKISDSLHDIIIQFPIQKLSISVRMDGWNSNDGA